MTDRIISRIMQIRKWVTYMEVEGNEKIGGSWNSGLPLFCRWGYMFRRQTLRLRRRKLFRPVRRGIMRGIYMIRAAGIIGPGMQGEIVM